MKRISVITPAYFAKPFICETIQSVVSQVLPIGVEIEHIVISDDLQDYREFSPKAPHYRMIFGATGSCGAGPSAARNVGMRMATGEFITFLDADDLWDSDRVVRLLPDADAVGAATCRMRVAHPGEEEGRPILPFVGDITPAQVLRIHGGFCPIYRREFAEHGWQEDIRFAEDVVFNLRATLNAGVLRVLDAPLMTYTVRSSSLSHAMPDACIQADAAYAQFLEAMRDWSWLPEDLRSAFRHRIAEKRRINREYLGAWRNDPSLTFERFIDRIGH
jgi:glycosyltransferase involved in cell wall biosynthesis